MHDYLNVRFARREDRDQITDLVNSHISAVIPGARVSVNTVLSSLDRQPDEYLLDPWIEERNTIVVERHDRVIGAAHLQRFATGQRVAPDYQGAGVIQWFLTIPSEASIPSEDSGDREPSLASPEDTLMRACLAQLAAWNVRVKYADGRLPFPGVYGIPEQWAHVQSCFERAGFTPDGTSETVFIAPSTELPALSDHTIPAGVTFTRVLGAHGVRFVAQDRTASLGFVEIDLGASRAERSSVGVRIAEVADWDYDTDATFDALLAQARDWLMLSEIDRLLLSCDENDELSLEHLRGLGFRPVTVTTRGWRLHSAS